MHNQIVTIAPAGRSDSWTNPTFDKKRFESMSEAMQREWETQMGNRAPPQGVVQLLVQ